MAEEPHLHTFPHNNHPRRLQFKHAQRTDPSAYIAGRRRVHALGDLTNRRSEAELRVAYEWVRKLDFPVNVVVAGM